MAEKPEAQRKLFWRCFEVERIYLVIEEHFSAVNILRNWDFSDRAG